MPLPLALAALGGELLSEIGGGAVDQMLEANPDFKSMNEDEFNRRYIEDPTFRKIVNEARMRQFQKEEVEAEDVLAPVAAAGIAGKGDGNLPRKRPAQQRIDIDDQPSRKSFAGESVDIEDADFREVPKDAQKTGQSATKAGAKTVSEATDDSLKLLTNARQSRAPKTTGLGRKLLDAVKEDKLVRGVRGLGRAAAKNPVTALGALGAAAAVGLSGDTEEERAAREAKRRKEIEDYLDSLESRIKPSKEEQKDDEEILRLERELGL